MQDLNDLYYFAHVVESGGFAQAGRMLGIPKSKLSRRISALEERLGVRLIQRSSRRFVVTEIGQVYYGHCKAMLVEAESAEMAIQQSQAEPCGIVRMTCPTAMLDSRIAAMVSDFMVRYPQVVVHLEDTNRRVDVLGEGVDLAIRVRPPPIEDSDLVMRVLGERGQVLVASPKLLKGLTIASPADLVQLPSMDLGLPLNEHQWTLYGPNGAEVVIRYKPRLITRGLFALRTAAVAGVGVVKLPIMMVTEELARGDLVRVLPEWAPRREILHLVFPSRRGLLPSVRALIDYFVERFAALDDE